MDITQVPLGLRSLVDRHGLPVDVETARVRWAELITAAGTGTITLITRDGYQWAALVPMSEVAEISPTLPTWPISKARAKLGHLVGEVHGLDVRVQVLTRHGRPVAALIEPTDLLDRPAPADRLAAEQLLQNGYRIELVFEPGRPGRMGEDGEVAEEPEERFYAATAYDNRGTVVAAGDGPTLGEALLRLTAPTPVEYANEAPF